MGISESSPTAFPSSSSPNESEHKRRTRYKGKNPRQFHQKYKELAGDNETWEKVIASGKTPAGAHRPIMLDEILDILTPQSGQTFIDCTLGYGGHSSAFLTQLLPEGRLIGLDTDIWELPKTTERLRQQFHLTEEEHFFPRVTNYAGLGKILQELAPEGVNGILADLGLSSMQIDNPERGFTYKAEGPLDMRMNPLKGISATELIYKSSPIKMTQWLDENADEPRAAHLGAVLAGKYIPTTTALRQLICANVPDWALESTLPRVFQAIRIAVNDEFSALDMLLRTLPSALKSGGRVAILTFHSGEDRRVKHAFRQGWESGIWSQISETVLRPTHEEILSNSRASCAKLRWAEKA